MSESPPTPAAGPPTAFDIIPDMLGTVTVSQTLIYNTEPTGKRFFMTLTAAALADSASRLRPVNRTQAEIRLNQIAL